MTDLERAPILRVVPGPTDINANGHIFGGWVLSQMDIAAGIVASRRAKGPVATVAIEAMEFLAPIHLRDLISVYASVEHVGRTSMAVRIEVVAHRDLGATEVKVTEGVFTFVALDANHRPRSVDAESSEPTRRPERPRRRLRPGAAARRGGGPARSSSQLRRRRSRHGRLPAETRRTGWFRRPPLTWSRLSALLVVAIASARPGRGGRGDPGLRRSAALAGVRDVLARCASTSPSASTNSSSPSSSSISSSRWRRGSALETGAALAQHAEIMVRDTGDNIRSDAIARELRVPRHALVLFEQLGGVAALAIVLRFPGCPPRFWSAAVHRGRAGGRPDDY